MKPELAQEFPEELKKLGDELPDVLLSYQSETVAAIFQYQVVVEEKSRRIGITWAVAAAAVLISGARRSAGGMDTIYIGYNLDMAREFIDTTAMWAKAFMPAASEVEEFLFKDQSEDGAEKDILAFRINFASGFEIIALTSKPRSLRGRQGFLIFDEAAFHDDLEGMMKAAMAFLLWGGKVLVISTHDGQLNAFNVLVEDCRKKRKPYYLLRHTFQDAIAGGLYERIKMMLEARGQDIAPKEEWIENVYDFYGDDADEELDVIPAEGSGTVLSTTLIEMRMETDIPVVRWEKPASWVREHPTNRAAEAEVWCDFHIAPLLEEMDDEFDTFFGQDFGRSHDLTVIWPVQVMQNLVRRAPFVVELACIPFAQQEYILKYILERLPRFRGGAMDAGGNGAQIAENLADHFGHDRIEQIKFSEDWYRNNMPRFIDAFEDGMVAIPRDKDVLGDHKILQRVKGIVKIPDIRINDTKSKGKKRHGDSAIAHALAIYATYSDVQPAAGASVPNDRDAYRPQKVTASGRRRIIDRPVPEFAGRRRQWV